MFVNIADFSVVVSVCIQRFIVYHQISWVVGNGKLYRVFRLLLSVIGVDCFLMNLAMVVSIKDDLLSLFS